MPWEESTSQTSSKTHLNSTSTNSSYQQLMPSATSRSAAALNASQAPYNGTRPTSKPHGQNSSKSHALHPHAAVSSEENSPINSPIGSAGGSRDSSPMNSLIDSLQGSPVGESPEESGGSPIEFSIKSPVGSAKGSTTGSANGSRVGSPVGSTHHGYAHDSASSAAGSQSIILSKVPRYVQLSVDQPQKVSDGSSSYVSYLVTAQQYPEEKPERVRRRFSEFAKLYASLTAEFPACAVPPLPDRWRIEYIAGDRFSPEFTTKRAASLERFLFRVSQHPSLRRSRAFALFLSSSSGGSMSGTTNAKSANGSAAAASRNGGGSAGAGNAASQESAAMVALDHLGEALMNAFAKARHQSKEMIDARERADRYEQNIATIDKAVVRASKTQNDLVADFEDMHRQAVKLAKLDQKGAAEFEQLAVTAQSLMGATMRLRQGIDSHFACALRDMAHYVQALKGMLKQREQRQIDYEALVEYLKNSEHELVAAEHGHSAPTFSSSFLRTKFNELRGVDKEQARLQRISKLKSRINVFKDESARAKQLSDDYEELAKCEVRVFDQTEAIELQQSLEGLSDSYIEFFQSVLDECRELEASLD